MASSVWKGMISFGLVSIPIRLFLDAPLTRETAYQTMWHGTKSDWWVLDYYFSK